MKAVILAVIFIAMVLVGIAIFAETGLANFVQLPDIMDFFQNKNSTENIDTTKRSDANFVTCKQLEQDLKDLNARQVKLANLYDHYGLQKVIKEKKEIMAKISKYCN